MSAPGPLSMLTVGECLGALSTAPGSPLRTTSSLRFSTAGAEATVAIGMSRLGLATAWVGTVGDDPVGDRILRDLRAEGVDTTWCRRHPDLPTGLMLRDHRTTESVHGTYYRRGLAGSQVCAEQVQRALAGPTPVDVVHLTGITPMLGESARHAVLETMRLAREAGTTVSFDVNYRSALGDRSTTRSVVEPMVGQVDVLFVGDDELDLVTDRTDTADALQDLAFRGPTEVVVKHGAAGATVLCDGRTSHVPGDPVTVLDVIGAGDSFVAGYLVARQQDLPPRDRLAWGTACAARTVGSHGDWEGLPDAVGVHDQLAGARTVR